ncbi:MAG: 16S rRNA (cytidine(1402)-2'-O)-methyltransferase [Candidatus Omnitrophica bacterium]|nr:16S rRNA (cytidine(1402)-2'-O)-methyltransferase [Candidatus Omnitrophota bacterium]
MLYIIPTPIGNLRDLTFRALDILQSVHKIICEDTRHTQRLLKHYEVSQTLVSFHEHSGPEKVQEIIKWMKEGQTLALVSDAGMPLISDPGYQVVREAIRNGIEVIALPGPTASVTALVKSGLPTDSYSFFGFIPKKTVGRKKFFETLKEREETLIFYESPYRVSDTLKDLQEVFGNREAAVVREISKKFEESKRGYLSDLIEIYSKKEPLGEIVIVVAGKDCKDAFGHSEA